MASSSGAAVNPLFGQAILEKLTKNNFSLWKTQILPVIRGARMEGYLTGATQVPSVEIEVKEGEKGDITKKVSNLAYEAWIAADQQVLGMRMHGHSIYLLSYENPAHRPDISAVVLMLSSNSTSLRTPSKPAFFFGSGGLAVDAAPDMCCWVLMVQTTLLTSAVNCNLSRF
ncbi:hypothetical protein OsI_14962 [Oryza sativa Indica Group]|uniref:Retrotransposon Copia-like N-terminal domain-containing protein n=1 Tax=Oryza sativa subsp. indica TaxID=39946 RepID=A2XQP6_ORYSI|nr:hypothetical protein OsI_14962 [Oryza sativa Indica Group]